MRGRQSQHLLGRANHPFVTQRARSCIRQQQRRRRALKIQKRSILLISSSASVKLVGLPNFEEGETISRPSPLNCASELKTPLFKRRRERLGKAHVCVSVLSAGCNLCWFACEPGSQVYHLFHKRKVAGVIPLYTASQLQCFQQKLALAPIVHLRQCVRQQQDKSNKPVCPLKVNSMKPRRLQSAAHAAAQRRTQFGQRHSCAARFCTLQL